MVYWWSNSDEHVRCLLGVKLLVGSEQATCVVIPSTTHTLVACMRTARMNPKIGQGNERNGHFTT